MGCFKASSKRDIGIRTGSADNVGIFIYGGKAYPIIIFGRRVFLMLINESEVPDVALIFFKAEMHVFLANSY